MTDLDGGESLELDDLDAEVALLVKQPLFLRNALLHAHSLLRRQRVLKRSERYLSVRIQAHHTYTHTHTEPPANPMTTVRRQCVNVTDSNTITPTKCSQRGAPHLPR